MIEFVKPGIPEDVVEGMRLQFVEIAKDQKEYRTLPAYYSPHTGAMITELELKPEDIANVAATGKLRLVIWTGGKPLQPLYPSSLLDIGELEEVGAL